MLQRRLPGEETEAVGATAREHNCYISFGACAQYKEWPRHIMSVAVVIGPDGNILAEAEDYHEELLTYRIPMADFRSGRRIPDVHTELYAHVMDGYKSRYAPGGFPESLPGELDEACRQFRENARW